jgi:hypothetical protein
MIYGSKFQYRMDGGNVESGYWLYKDFARLRSLLRCNHDAASG